MKSQKHLINVSHKNKHKLKWTFKWLLIYIINIKNSEYLIVNIMCVKECFCLKKLVIIFITQNTKNNLY